VADDTKLHKQAMYIGLAKPYLIGARLQIGRYIEANYICLENGVLGVQLCFHEVSNLCEDLAALSGYLEAIGMSHPDHKLWADLRHHIRHDIREELDKDEGRKSGRAERLKLNDKLQMDMRFDKHFIKVGGTRLELSRVEAYLDWATTQIDGMFKDAASAGIVKQA
jgi:hypothetical protein